MTERVRVLVHRTRSGQAPTQRRLGLGGERLGGSACRRGLIVDTMVDARHVRRTTSIPMRMRALVALLVIARAQSSEPVTAMTIVSCGPLDNGNDCDALRHINSACDGSLAMPQKACRPSDKDSSATTVWISGTSYCAWVGVECDVFGRVTALAITDGCCGRGDGMYANPESANKFPADAIGKLEQLTRLDLSGNMLVGPLEGPWRGAPFDDDVPHSGGGNDSALSNWWWMLEAGLEHTWLSKLDRLTYLDLSSNMLTGPLPAALADACGETLEARLERPTRRVRFPRVVRSFVRSFDRSFVRAVRSFRSRRSFVAVPRRGGSSTRASHLARATRRSRSLSRSRLPPHPH